MWGHTEVTVAPPSRCVVCWDTTSQEHGKLRDNGGTWLGSLGSGTLVGAARPGAGVGAPFLPKACGHDDCHQP